MHAFLKAEAPGPGDTRPTRVRLLLAVYVHVVHRWA